MEPRIEILKEKKLIGHHIQTSLIKDETFKLWSGFMPQKKEIKNICGNNLYSVRIYKLPLKEPKDFEQNIEKWATMEVRTFDDIPENMNSLVLEGGLYAVFNYTGLNTDVSIFNYIYDVWISSSIYNLDNRPHFEVLGKNYKNNDPTSEEEIWIPIKLKV